MFLGFRIQRVKRDSITKTTLSVGTKAKNLLFYKHKKNIVRYFFTFRSITHIAEYAEEPGNLELRHYCSPLPAEFCVFEHEHC